MMALVFALGVTLGAVTIWLVAEFRKTGESVWVFSRDNYGAILVTSEKPSVRTLEYWFGQLYGWDSGVRGFVEDLLEHGESEHRNTVWRLKNMPIDEVP